jgi:hypothetical protein
MRRLRRCPARIRICVSLVWAPLALPMTLTGCAAPTPTPTPLASVVDTQPSGVGAEGMAAMLRTQQDEASLPLSQWFVASASACSSPCLSVAEQEAIVARAVAEHEMRRP